MFEDKIKMLKLDISRYEEMIETRNKAIVKLSKRAKEAEELTLSDPQNVVEKESYNS